LTDTREARTGKAAAADRAAAGAQTPQRLRRAVFIDRDGVLNEERGYVCAIDDFRLLPGAVEGLRRLRAAGFALVGLTNQAGIAHGYYTEEQFARLTAHMNELLRENGVALDGFFFCPHHPAGSVARFRLRCDCRKPAPGMVLQAARELSLDLARSVLVGDKISDTDAGRAAGVGRTILVRSGHTLPDDAACQADDICADLLEAAHIICEGS